MSKDKKNYGFVVAETEEAARAKAIKKFPELAGKKFKLRQDDDVLDTWFSSWLWPISVFDGINNPDNKDINYYYPTTDLVTAPDIIFFWVARMIMAGYEYRNEKCFYNVYYTGMVRDKLGRKMSKSLGNSPDPLDLIAKYGADAVRMGMLLTSPAGNDLPFDEALCETGRNFCNKIWNAFRLVKSWEVDYNATAPEKNEVVMEWFRWRLKNTRDEINDLFSKYRLSEALTLIYKLFWDEFSAWYLEIVKPEFGKPIDKYTYENTMYNFYALLMFLHPFMPFITEELYHKLEEEYKEDEYGSIMNELYKDLDLSFPEEFVETYIEFLNTTIEIIAGIRNIRQQKNISPKEPLKLQILGGHIPNYDDVIKQIANIEKIEFVKEKAENSVSFMVGTTEYAVPVGNLINVEEEIAKLETELKYQEGFLRSVMGKLSNEKFVANAKPEIVEVERKKQSDAESKIASLKESIEQLKK